MMKRTLILLLTVLPALCFGQQFSYDNKYGTTHNRDKFDSVVILPKGLLGLNSGKRTTLSGYDTAQIRYNIMDSSIYVHTGFQWRQISGGVSGVTNIASGYGLSGGPITTTGTLLLDSATLSAYYLRRKDSTTDYTTQFDILYKLNTSDSATMLSNYLRGATEGFGIDITGTQHKTWAVDTFSTATRAWRQKGVDSLLSIINRVKSKGITLEGPGSAENFGMWQTQVAITVSSINAVVIGSSPSVTINIAFGTDITSLTNVFSSGTAITSTTTGQTINSGFNDATIPAGSWIRLRSTASSGTITQIEVTINYTED